MHKLLGLNSIFCLLVICLTISCKKKEETPFDGNSGVVFLKTGTKYIYNTALGSYNSWVEKETGKDTFQIRSTSETIDVYPSVYFALKDGNLSRSIRLRDPGSYVIICKFNQPAGTTWNITDENGNVSVLTIDSTNTKINTGNGWVTDAIKVKSVTGNSTTYTYYSPTVGFLGTGSLGTSSPIELVDYTISTASPSGAPYPITYGNFPFTKIGNSWEYLETTASGKDNVLKTIDNKVGRTNIFKVKVERASKPGTTSFEYWYEDHGLLMVYEDGESLVQADVAYMDESSASVGNGWVGKSKSGEVFVSKISNLNTPQMTGFGNLNCMEISIQTGGGLKMKDYWNKDKGNVLTTGDISRELVSSNARLAK